MNTLPLESSRYPAESGEQQRIPFLLGRPLPQLLYYLIIIYIPFFRWRSAGEVKFDWILTAGVYFFAIIQLLVNKRLPSSLDSNLNPWLLLFFLVNVIATLLTPYPVESTEGLILLLQSYLFVVVNLMMITERGFKSTLPLVLCWAVSLNSLLADMGYYLHIELFTTGRRGYGGTIGANNSALMGLFVLPLLLHMLRHEGRAMMRIVFLAMTSINFLAIIASESRGGFVVLLVMSLLLLIEHGDALRPRNVGLVVAGLAVAALMLIAMVPREYVERQQTLTQGVAADKSLSRRAAYLEVGFESFGRHPILGTGPDSFRAIFEKSYQNRFFKMDQRPAHNTYMEVLVGSGALGLLLFATILVLVYRNFSRAREYFMLRDNEFMVSLIKAYQLSFVSILCYFMLKSAIEHKLFLLILSVSIIALHLTKESSSATGLRS